VKDIKTEKGKKINRKTLIDIIELGNYLTVVIPEGPSAELRRLTQARERAIERRTMLVNQVHESVSVVFPEFLPACAPACA